MTDPILERYIQIIEDYKNGDITPDGESTLEIDSDGNKRWYNKRGQFHRRDGPAIETPGGSKQWWVNDKLHREDGPAVEWDNGDRYWYIHGNSLTEDKFYTYIVNKAIKINRKKK